MAVIRMDGFDKYQGSGGVASFNAIWSWGGLEQDAIHMVPGRFEGSNAVALGTVGRDYHSWRYLGLPIGQATMGVAVKLTDHGAKSILGFGVAGVEALSLIKNHMGQMEVRRGRGFGWESVLLATSERVDLLSVDGWHYVEFAATGGGSGAAKVWVNGDLVIDAVGIDCGAPLWNSFGLGMNSSYRHYDDWYLSTGMGGVGEIRIDTLDANANTDEQDFTTFGADEAWQAISEDLADGELSYITSNTVGARSVFELENASSTIEDVIAVQVRGYSAKLDAGTRAVKYFLKSGSAEAAGADHYLAISYTYSFDMHNTHPSGAPWTPAAIDTLKLGVEVSV